MSARTTDQVILTVAVPPTIRQRSGRKLLLLPSGKEITARPQSKNKLVKVLVRAFR